MANLEAKEKFSNKKIALALGLAIISLIGLAYYFRKQRIYKRRFEHQMKTGEAKVVKHQEIENDKKTTSLPAETVKDILNKLTQLEKEEGFLRQELTLQSLSKIFDTNSNYLSKVVNFEKGINFTSYLSNLRIEYRAKRLKDDYKFRRYTIKAFSKECGFGTSESFSKAFCKKYRIYPSYYIKQLENK